MQASQLYLVAEHQPPLLLSTVGWVRAKPHLLLVLVSYCRLCEEDVGMYDSEQKTLHVAKLNLTVRVTGLAGGLQWQGERVPSTYSLSTQPFPLATLPEAGRAELLSPAHAQYRMAYHHYGRALARYTDCKRFETALQPWMFQECLSWLSTPPALQPPARVAGSGHVNL
jgi:hypothetical protein